MIDIRTTNTSNLESHGIHNTNKPLKITIGNNHNAIFENYNGYLIRDKKNNSRDIERLPIEIILKENFNLNTLTNALKKYEINYNNYPEEINVMFKRINEIRQDIMNGKITLNGKLDGITNRAAIKNVITFLEFVKENKRKNVRGSISRNSNKTPFNESLTNAKKLLNKLDQMNFSFEIISKAINYVQPIKIRNKVSKKVNPFIFIKRTNRSIIDLYPYDVDTILKDIKFTNLNKEIRSSPLSYFHISLNRLGLKRKPIYIDLFRKLLASYNVNLFEIHINISDDVMNTILKVYANHKDSKNVTKIHNTVRASINNIERQKNGIIRKTNTRSAPSFNTYDEYASYIHEKVSTSKHTINILSLTITKYHQETLNVNQMGHANTLLTIKDIKNNKILIYRIEPNGFLYILDDINIVLNKIFKDERFTYGGYIEQSCFAPSVFFDDLKFGLQSNSGGGTCMYWSMYLTMLIIMNSNMKEPIINIAEHFQHEFDKFFNYVSKRISNSNKALMKQTGKNNGSLVLKKYSEEQLKRIFYGHKIKVFMRYVEYLSTKMTHFGIQNKS